MGTQRLEIPQTSTQEKRQRILKKVRIRQKSDSREAFSLSLV